MNSNGSTPDNHLEAMMARYRLQPNDSTPDQQPVDSEAPDDDQPMTRREAKNRQSMDRNEDMEDQSFWDRAKRYALPAVLGIGVLLSVVTRLI